MVSVKVSQSGSAIVGSLYVGSTQDAIQQAVSYVSSQGGGSVSIEKGIYTINSPIDLYSNIEIYGEFGHTILKSNVLQSDSVLRILGSGNNGVKENIYIHDLLIGNSDSTHVGGNGIFADLVGTNGKGLTISDCIFQYNKNDGIKLLYGYNSTITNNIICNNLGDGIDFVECNYNFIMHNQILNNGGSAFDVSYSKRNVFTENIISNHDDWSVSFLVTANTILSNNIIVNSLFDGVTLQNDESNQQSNLTQVYGNVIQNNTTDGIYLRGGTDSSIIANSIQNNNGRGIYCSSSVFPNRITVSSNLINHNNGASFNTNGATNTSVTSNVMTNNVQGTLLAGSKNTLSANIIKNNSSSNFVNTGTNNTVQSNITS